ncbi:MAG: cob(I)yrinic acid a,c-diamide adenosyltransferase [Planctomycetota bacterium]|jgi:cob(I)alamin adenosyltransferase
MLYASIGLAYNTAMLDQGLVQIYTGDGKGKTTAAFGLALRAAGQGNKVLIYQFLKPPKLDVGERFALQLGAVRIRVEALDVPWDMSASRDDEKAVGQMRAAIAEVLEKITETAEKRFYDVLILDEIVFCLSEGLASLEDVKALIDRRDPGVEIVLTGRGATDELIALSDLVTEMKNLKHPLDAGLPARRGIEY